MNKPIGVFVFISMVLMSFLNACVSTPQQNFEPKIPGLAQTLAVQTLNARPSRPLIALQPTKGLAAFNLAPTFTPFLTRTPVPQLTSAPYYMSAHKCENAAEFVKDITVQDGEVLRPGKKFTKTWEIKNTGTCTWTPDYSLVYVWGDQLNGISPSPLGRTVKPGYFVDIAIDMVAPLVPGDYQSDWMLQDPDGNQFGTGYNATEHIWASISCAMPGFEFGCKSGG